MVAYDYIFCLSGGKTFQGSHQELSCADQEGQHHNFVDQQAGRLNLPDFAPTTRSDALVRLTPSID